MDRVVDELQANADSGFEEAPISSSSAAAAQVTPLKPKTTRAKTTTSHAAKSTARDGDAEEVDPVTEMAAALSGGLGLAQLGV